MLIMSVKTCCDDTSVMLEATKWWGEATKWWGGDCFFLGSALRGSRFYQHKSALELKCVCRGGKPYYGPPSFEGGGYGPSSPPLFQHHCAIIPKGDTIDDAEIIYTALLVNLYTQDKNSEAKLWQ